MFYGHTPFKYQTTKHEGQINVAALIHAFSFTVLVLQKGSTQT